jgi:hypothetical protein
VAVGQRFPSVAGAFAFGEALELTGSVVGSNQVRVQAELLAHLGKQQRAELNRFIDCRKGTVRERGLAVKVLRPELYLGESCPEVLGTIQYDGAAYIAPCQYRKAGT